MEDDVISSSQVQPTELSYFLDFKFCQVLSVANIIQCSIEELVVEAFKFVFPDGIPDYYFKRYSKTDCSWVEIAPWFCAQFFSQQHRKWLKDKFTLDYTDTSLAEFVKQQDVVDETIKSVFADQEGYDLDLLDAVYLANEMHVLFDYLARDEREGLGEDSSKRDISEKHDKVKNMMYKMINFLGISCKVNGATRYEFYYPIIPDRKHGGVIIKVKPDATMCIDIPGGHYPYCAIEVYGPFSEEVLPELIHSEDSSSTDAPTAEVKNSDLVEKVQKLSLLDTKKAATKDQQQLREIKKDPSVLVSNSKQDSYLHQRRKELDYETEKSFYTSRSIPLILKKEIVAVSPIPAKLVSAFQKSTAQLPLEMFGQVVEQEEIRQGAYGDWFTNRRDNCETIGLFVMNEYIYLEKIRQTSSIVRMLAQRKVNFVADGPSVSFSNWKFDLKKPNHRLALMVFMFYHREISLCEAITQYWKRKVSLNEK